MNILFVTKDFVNPLCGGISRITYLLASELQKRGYVCVSAYKYQNGDSITSDVFETSILLKEKSHIQQLNDIITANQIQIIVVQSSDITMNKEMVYLRQVIDSQSYRIPLLYVMHSMPGYELHSMDLHILINKISSKSWKRCAKQCMIQIILPFNKSLLQKRLYSKYNTPYKNADKVVVLSPAYIEDFNHLAGGTNKVKYMAIPNMLTYPILHEIPQNKAREVLLVGRMDDHSKRVKLAIQIWARLPQEILDKGWNLVIVGDGEDLSYYKRYVKDNAIMNVQFEGLQEPLSYYQKASIFMMTSAFEGWPMTLMEALQNGCVPIAFDSFKAVYDIIDTGKSGVIIPEGDIKMYTNQLVHLMEDDEKRARMAQEGLLSCQKFSRDKITQKWIDLFDKLLAE